MLYFGGTDKVLQLPPSIGAKSSNKSGPLNFRSSKSIDNKIRKKNKIKNKIFYPIPPRRTPIIV
jgi:hypothetical protein